MKLDEIKDPRLRARILAADVAQNCHALAPIPSPKPQRNPVPALDGGGRQRRQSTGRLALVVTLITFRNRFADSDGEIFALKPVRDAIAASLGIDDGDKRVRWQYGQIQTAGEQGVLIRIELL